MMIKNNMGKASRGNQSIQANIITRVLTKNENLALLKKIYSGLTILVRNKQLSADLLQFSNSFLESYAEILKSGSADVRDPNNKSYQLVAYQWSKANANTFLLGKDVGCCMAPDGMAFDAFIARRLDDAIIFHVVRNQLTNKIIAVAWLYLAITSDNQVVLVANFFDVNFKIGQQPALRQALLTGLLKFIEQYLQDNPQITRFYMTPMGYGWNEGDLNSYEMVKLDIVDKIGGLYIPTTVPEFFKKCMTLYNAYNLNFADEDEFHCFSNEVLNREVAMMPNLRLPLASAPFNSSPKRRRCEFWQPNDRNLELVSPTASQPSGNGHDFPLPKSK